MRLAARSITTLFDASAPRRTEAGVTVYGPMGLA
jgi:hypothetical protein